MLSTKGVGLMGWRRRPSWFYGHLVISGVEDGLERHRGSRNADRTLLKRIDADTR